MHALGCVVVGLGLVLVAGCFPPALPADSTDEDAAGTTDSTDGGDDTNGADGADHDPSSPDTANDIDGQEAECASGADCIRTDLCMGVPTCVSGRCTFDSPVLCTSTEPCVESVCRPETGICGARAAPRDTPCDDGNACTRIDVCGDGAQAGSCVGTDPVDCSRPSDCQAAGVCNPLSGVCLHEPEPDGKLCNDGMSPHGDAAPGTCSTGECHRLPIVRVGNGYACALFADSRLRCWGANQSGQLGYGTTVNVGDGVGPHVREAGVLDLENVRDVSLGVAMTCALTGDGRVRCWGVNAEGSLGYGDLDPRGGTPATTPGKVPALGLPADVVAISVSRPETGSPLSSTTACALSAEGSVRCWGRSSILGYPSVHDVGTPTGLPLADIGPISLWESEGQATRLSSGRRVQCAVRHDGYLRCWGYANLLGIEPNDAWGAMLGDEEPFANEPTPSLDGAVRDVCVSDLHVCAVTQTGKLYCWGFGDQGRLGSGSTVDELIPQAPVSVGGVVSSVGCGRNHTCAHIGNNVRCWGGNASGQLGLGTTLSYPQQFGQLPSALPPLTFGSPVMQLAVGATHNCVVLRNAEVRCWGSNGGGQLGVSHTSSIGDGPDEWPPEPVLFQ